MLNDLPIKDSVNLTKWARENSPFLSANFMEAISGQEEVLSEDAYSHYVANILETQLPEIPENLVSDDEINELNLIPHVKEVEAEQKKDQNTVAEHSKLGVPRRHTDNARIRALNSWFLEYKPPTKELLREITELFNSLAFRLEIINLKNIPPSKGAQPVIFVGNHSYLGLEIPSVISAVYNYSGVLPRGMAHHYLWRVPGIRNVLRAVGVCDGNVELASRLLSSGEWLMVYPGGARELLRTKQDGRYELYWKDHTGFVRLALQHRAIIVPFVTVGVEDCLEVKLNIPTPSSSINIPLYGPRNGTDVGHLRKVVSFCQPIDTSRFSDRDPQDRKLILGIQRLTKRRIEAEILQLLMKRVEIIEKVISEERHGSKPEHRSDFDSTLIATYDGKELEKKKKDVLLVLERLRLSKHHGLHLGE